MLSNTWEKMAEDLVNSTNLKETLEIIESEEKVRYGFSQNGSIFDHEGGEIPHVIFGMDTR